MKVLKQGTNGWTCMPDSPSPGVDPMCFDKNGMDWADAWMTHKDPPKDKMAIGYMLMGGSDASNTDPFATEPQGRRQVGRHRAAHHDHEHRRSLRRLPDDGREHEGAVRDVRGHAVRALDDSGEVIQIGVVRQVRPIRRVRQVRGTCLACQLLDLGRRECWRAIARSRDLSYPSYRSYLSYLSQAPPQKYRSDRKSRADRREQHEIALLEPACRRARRRARAESSRPSCCRTARG